MIVNLLATWIPALFFVLLGALKLAGNQRVVKELTELGYVRMLGVMEVAFAVLFVIPATFKLGFLLAACYQAGAITTELARQTKGESVRAHCGALDWRLPSRPIDLLLSGTTAGN